MNLSNNIKQNFIEMKSDIDSNINININPINDIIHNNNNDIVDRITHHGLTLWEILNEDKQIMLFFKFIGFYFSYDKNDNILTQVILKIWNVAFLSLSLYGFIQRSLIFGGPQIKNFFVNFNISDAEYTSNTIKNGEEVLSIFLCPLLQVISISSSLLFFNSKLHLEESKNIRKLLPKVKRDIIIFIITMLIYELIIFILCEGQYFAILKPKRIFYWICAHLLFYASLLFFLGIDMLFINIYLRKATMLQKELLILANDNKLKLNIYLKKRTAIERCITDIFIGANFVTIVAFVNTVALFFTFGLSYNVDQAKFFDDPSTNCLSAGGI